jgi:hypothetical protein
MKKNSVLLLVLLGLVYVCEAAPAMYLSVIKNDTPETIYKIIIPAENYEILLPPGTQKHLSEWFDMQRYNESQRDSDVQLAVMQGEGDPIFIKQGPESSGCDKDMMAQSLMFWTGAPTVDSSQKTYQTYCLTDRDLKLELSIDPEGNPIVSESKA